MSFVQAKVKVLIGMISFERSSGMTKFAWFHLQWCFNLHVVIFLFFACHVIQSSCTWFDLISSWVMSLSDAESCCCKEIHMFCKFGLKSLRKSWVSELKVGRHRRLAVWGHCFTSQLRQVNVFSCMSLQFESVSLNLQSCLCQNFSLNFCALVDSLGLPAVLQCRMLTVRVSSKRDATR